MGINKGEKFAKQDIFVDYEFETVMFRWDHLTKMVYRKFYSEQECPLAIDPANNLFNHALRFGEEITKEDYLKGK